MRDKIDFSLVGALLRKQRQERRYIFRKGNFDFLGFLLQIALIGTFVAFFVIFFGRFMDIYLTIKTHNMPDQPQRLYELLTIAYMLIIVFMTLSGMTAITREMFLADDIKLFSAMPVGAKTLFVAKLISIYRGQLLYSAVTILTVNVTVAVTMTPGAWFYIFTLLLVFLLPVITIAFASILALPFYAIRRFLNSRFVLMFIVVTLLTAGAFVLYSFILGAVKDLLLGDDIRYFFNESVMNGIRVACRYFYPANWISSLMLGHEYVRSSVGIVLVTVFCAVVAMLIIRSILTRVLQARISGDEHFMFPEQDVLPLGSTFGALLKKEFVQIFRTPSYMFSYFSVAVLMPLMVYFCIEVGASLVETLIGINVDLELALFLTLLFSALTNVFCATNISREGPMFYSVKALPVSCRRVFFSKVFFCMIVSVISQVISAVVLGATGYVTWPVALFIFAIGSLFSFAQICFATRYDFNHARFSSEDDGEIKETGSTVSAIIVLGMLFAFLIGGVVLIGRIMLALRFDETASLGYLTYIIVGLITVLVAVLSFVYLIAKLNKKYYEFSGGGLM